MLEVVQFGVWSGQLEVRQDGDRPVITGSFPLETTATVSNKGRVRKERFRSGSMSWQVREFQKLQQEFSRMIGEAWDDVQKELRLAQLEDALEKRNTHLLIGHSYDKAIADMKTGTLAVRHTPKSVELEAMLPPLDEQPSWVKDAVLGIKGGQLRGISPGFQVTAKGAERLIPEDGLGDALVREILDSAVYEYSLVARPSYPLTRVDARADNPLERTVRKWWR